jgi:alpha-glucosidase
MKKKSNLFLFGLVVIMTTTMCSPKMKKYEVYSPDERLRAEFYLKENKPYYAVWKDDMLVIDTSILGFQMRNMPNLDDNFRVVETNRETKNETWTQPWGEEKEILNHYNELKILLFNKAENLHLNIIFRVFDDGMGFRYEIPIQTSYDYAEISRELTQFKIPQDHLSWWIPGNPDSYEFLYNNTPVSNIDSANTPVTIKASDSLYLSIHEAALTNYAGMRLKRTEGDATSLQCDLVPWPDGIKVKGDLPLHSPWRTIQIGNNAGDLIESHLILNLNEPNKLQDISYIKPMKYIGIWWGMHIDVNTWHEGPRHGATTENAKRYIDFASKHNIKGVLIEGWNKGWESWLSGNNVQNYTKPTDDFDMEEIAQFASEKGVKIIGHHETGGNIPMYEKQMKDAFAYYKNLGVHAIKTGYAGQMKPEGMFHHGQFMVNHYRKVVEMAHDHEIMIDAHEPIKPTGIRRTYPNMMTREGVRGMEYNAWSDGNTPDHTTILPFTRMLAGPLDYTPGIFNIMLDKHKEIRRKHAGENFNRRVHTTLAKQLGLFVILYSPLQMAADLIENYEGHPAFKFIEDVPVNWEKSIVINGEIGEYITMARKDIHSPNWFLGSITNEEDREFKVKLDFLDENITYHAEIYKDGLNADWKHHPTEYEIDHKEVKKNDKLRIELAPGGGMAVKFYPTED